MLGRPHRICGRVVSGAGRARAIGFPTANLHDCPVLVPPEAVYAGRVAIAGRDWPAAVNIGTSPTFADETRKLEIHVIDYAGEMPHDWLEVDLLDRLRAIQKFDNPTELTRQIHVDIQRVRDIFLRSATDASA